MLNDIEPYLSMTDEELVLLAKKGDEDATNLLFERYKNFVKAKARSYFLIGADREDIIQEGMIGLYKAMRDYNPEKQTCFKVFSELCITRKMITAIKTATRQKHIPLNTYVSLNKPIYDDGADKTLIDTLQASKLSNPEEILIGREEFKDIEIKIAQMLTPLEKEVLSSYLKGKSYVQIAQDQSREIKSIDNALQRVKRKLEKYLAER